MRKMKNLTYGNLMVVINRLIKEKHYGFEDAERIARNIFRNAENNPFWENPVEHFYNCVLSREDFEAEYATA